MITIAVFVGLVGLAMGSFADAVAWRIHTKRDFVKDRSECEHCHHKLGALDLIPVVSWATLGGKCRYCKHPIPATVPLVELGMGLAFGLSFLYWPFGFGTWQGVALFGFWAVYLVLLGILFVYDLRWQLLSDAIVYPLIGFSFVDAALRVSFQTQATVADYASHVVLGVVAMAGVYALLYMISRGKWVGFGDVKLAVFIGAILGWEKTLVVLMLANVLGLLVVLPGLVSKKLTAKSHVPFGPFMIVAFVVVGLFGDAVIRWYLQTFVQI